MLLFLFLWMLILFIMLASLFNIADRIGSFDERQRYHRLKGYQFGFAGILAVVLVLFFMEDFPVWLDFRNRLFLLMVGGAIPFIVYSTWYDAYFKSGKKLWGEVSYLLAVILIEFLSLKVISSEYFNLKTHFILVMQAIWFGVAGLTTLVKLIWGYFEERE